MELNFQIKLFIRAVFLVLIPLLAYAGQEPDFLIIGTQKGGTTSLYAYLSKHPKFLPSRLDRTRFMKQKEVHFFNKNYHKGIEWYLNLFTKKTAPGQVVGEASPLYIFDAKTPRRVYKHFPNLKFILLLRNPVDRAFSAHRMYSKNRKRETRTFDEAVTEELALIKNRKTPQAFRNILKKDLLLTRGIYLPQLKRWLRFFKKEQFLIIRSEDFFDDPAKTMAKVYAFLRLPPHEIKDFPIFLEGNKNKQMSDQTRATLSKFFEPYNKALQEYLTNELKLDLILNWK